MIKSSPESSERLQNETSSVASYTPYVPITPNTSEFAALSAPFFRKNPIRTRTMIHEAIKELSTKSHNRFSYAKIRKYILLNYLHTANQVKHRLPLIKKYFKTAIENGEIVKVNGAGLTGSFRVPRKSPLHKNIIINRVKTTKRISKTTKNQKKEKLPVFKPKKIKKDL